MFAFWRASQFYYIPHVRASDIAEAMAILINSMHLDFPDWIPEKHNIEGIREMSSLNYWSFLWIDLSDNLQHIE